MIELTFISENQSDETLAALRSYEDVWREFGGRIADAFEKICKFPFPVLNLSAIIYDGISQSHPLKLRAHLDRNRQLGDLIHELGHIAIVDGPTRRFESSDNENTRAHKALDLILYDVLVEVTDKTFADEQVSHERTLSEAYSNAWAWALQMTQEERQQLFASHHLAG